MKLGFFFFPCFLVRSPVRGSSVRVSPKKGWVWGPKLLLLFLFLLSSSISIASPPRDHHHSELLRNCHPRSLGFWVLKKMIDLAKEPSNTKAAILQQPLNYPGSFTLSVLDLWYHIYINYQKPSLESFRSNLLGS